MASYVFQLFKKVFFSVDKKSESGEKSGGKRKYCEMGVGTGDDLETTPPPRKKLNLGTKPPEQIPPVSAPTMDEVRRKSCTNFGDLVKFEETFGLPPPTLISGEIGEGSVDKTTPTVATSTSTSTNTSDTPTTTPTTTADTKTTKVAPTDTKSSKTDSTEAKGDDPKAEAEKKEKEEEEFIKSHEVHVVANGRHGISTQPPPDFSSPSLQNYDLNNQIDFLRKNVINPIKCRELYKTGNISLPKGIYFHGGDINCQALLLVKALATELGKEFGDGAKPLRIFRRWKVDVFSKYSGDGGAEVFVDWLFSAATKFQPSIIFIENLDQFGSYCRHDIFTNHELVAKLGERMDTLIPGEVLVIATIAAPTRTFQSLNDVHRFTKFLQFPTTITPKGILGCLKMLTETWTETWMFPKPPWKPETKF